eukprot:5143057-Pleurochrysis_carterae.AAC.1
MVTCGSGVMHHHAVRAGAKAVVGRMERGGGAHALRLRHAQHAWQQSRRAACAHGVCESAPC